MMRVLITGCAGYVGSALSQYLDHLGHIVFGVDPATADIPDLTYVVIRYQNAEPDLIDRADAIIHLAAHSSVAACQADPVGAWANNVLDLDPFARKCVGKRFIFASTGSLYSSSTTQKVYDRSKWAAEGMLNDIDGLNPLILRFATVAGVSPVMREDLILNGMVRDAVREGVVRVRNQHVHRPVLFLEDLCWTIARFLDGPAIIGPGPWPLASFQARIGSWADIVAKHCGAEIVTEPDTPTYDFSMPTLARAPGRLETVLDELKAYWEKHPRDASHSD